MNNKGSITITLSISLLAIIALMLILIEGARICTAGSEAKLRLGLATESLMAEYDPNIYNNYHLFVFDRGYGEKEAQLNNVNNKVINYIDNTLSYNNDNESKTCYIGLTLDNVEVSFQKSVRNVEDIKEQACKYMKYNLTNDRKIRLRSILKESNNSYNDILWCEYLLQHFRSCLNRDKPDQINRKRVYELEYIIYGCQKDNDNYEKCSEDKEFIYSEYEEKIVNMICKGNNTEICKRIIELIIQNTNNNYGTNINKDNCFFGVEVKAEFSMKAKVAAWKLANIMVNKNIDRYIYKEKYTYIY